MPTGSKYGRIGEGWIIYELGRDPQWFMSRDGQVKKIDSVELEAAIEKSKLHSRLFYISCKAKMEVYTT